MGQVLLLVEAGLLQTEGVDEVDDLLSTVLEGLLLLLGRWVTTNVDVASVVAKNEKFTAILSAIKLLGACYLRATPS